MEVFSDASGHWGCVAWSGSQWLAGKWLDTARVKLPNTVKKLFPILLMAVLWGHQWIKRRVQFFRGNEAVVAIICSRKSRQLHLMHLFRCLFLVEAHHDTDITCTHIAGNDNALADDLSNNRTSEFHLKVPGAAPHPTPVPTSLLELLLDKELDWLSPQWTAQFNTSVERV